MSDARAVSVAIAKSPRTLNCLMLSTTRRIHRAQPYNAQGIHQPNRKPQRGIQGDSPCVMAKIPAPNPSIAHTTDRTRIRLSLVVTFLTPSLWNPRFSVTARPTTTCASPTLFCPPHFFKMAIELAAMIIVATLTTDQKSLVACIGMMGLYTTAVMASVHVQPSFFWAALQ